jgi:RNA-directed DNA polymerase
MKWVRRKHPRKPIVQASAKYIVTGKTHSNHKWVWGVNKNEDEMNKLVILNISEIKPSKHPLLKLDKNPYLLEDRCYFDHRLIKKGSAKFRETIFKKYNHLCPICQESLHNGEKVELHHIISVKDGGKYTLANIQPLHQLCHISITHNKLTIRAE